MEEWIDKKVHAVIESDYDEITGVLRPIISIGDKKLSWEEFGDEVISFEGWSFDFKFSSLFMPPEEKND